MKDAILLLVWIVGCSLGLFAGWCIWRRPYLNYKPDEELNHD